MRAASAVVLAWSALAGGCGGSHAGDAAGALPKSDASLGADAALDGAQSGGDAGAPPDANAAGDGGDRRPNVRPPRGGADAGVGPDCADRDRDGYLDGACGGDDCDDGNPAVRPDAAELCGNDLDDDCDPATPDEWDTDGDGVSCALDCDDGDPVEPARTGSCDGVFYRADFEDGPVGWTTGGENSSWVHARPGGPFVDRAASGEWAWVTGARGNYNKNELSFLYSPRFDFSQLDRDPVLMLSLIYQIDETDSVTVQQSVDGGTYRTVGAFGSGFGWYARSANDWQGESGQAGEWHPVFHRLDGTAGHADVRIRFVLYSDAAHERDGVGIDDLRILTDFTDLAVEPLALPAAGCASREALIVNASVHNLGNQAISNVRLGYTLDTEPQVIETFEGLIAPGERKLLRFAARASLATPGRHTIRVAVADARDAFALDDHAEASTTTLELLDGADYATDFEHDDGGLVAYGIRSTWAWRTPRGGSIDAAASGERAWLTDSTDESANEMSFLQTPCFDFSGLEDDPVVHFAQRYDMELNQVDRASMQITVDGGATWRTLGEVGSGSAWYSDPDGWMGRSDPEGHYRIASHRLDDSAGRGEVSLRWQIDYFRGGGEGMAIDDLRVASSVRDLALEDAGVLEVGCSGRSGDPFRIEVVNRGTEPVSQFVLGYSVDGGAWVTETVEQALAPGGRYQHVFTLGSELGAIGPHRLTARVSATGDEIPGNDTRVASSTTQQIVTGVGYTEDFELSGGGWIATGFDPSWAWGRPDGAIIRSAASGTRAWVTGLGEGYHPFENSKLYSICLDFAGTSDDPTLQFAHIVDSDGENVAWLEISRDGGASFEKLGSYDSGTGWYDSVEDHWGGDPSAPVAWHTAGHVLQGVAGHATVLLRIVFVADTLFGLVAYEGQGIDDIAILP